jgi:Flp pilus assembly protein TadG
MNRRSTFALRLRRDEDGSALVEGAILLPILVVLFVGIFEFSWFFYQQHLITLGVRDAARYLARMSDPCEPTAPLWAAAEARARNLAATGSIDGGAARVNGWTAAMVTAKCRPIANVIDLDGLPSYRGGPAVFVVTVSTRFRDPTLGFFGLLGLDAPQISASHSERVIGPG